MKVYVCGSESLTLPVLVNGTETVCYNNFRYHLVLDWLTFELTALHNVGLLTSLAYDSVSTLSMFFNGQAARAFPIGNIPSIVSLANAITVFGAQLIMNVGGGYNSVVEADAVQALEAQALAAGVLWRDASNIGYVNLPYPVPPVGAIFTLPQDAPYQWSTISR